MGFFPNNPVFMYQAQRLLAECSPGGGEATEIGWAVDRITEGDFDSWYSGWTWLGDRARVNGEQALASGHRVSAREHLFRAANYYRQANFFLTFDDPHQITTWKKMASNFKEAGNLADPPFEWIASPYESGHTLPGFIVRPNGAKGRLPTIVYLNGADGTKEESWFLGKGFVDRGANFVTIDGPGQGEPLRLHKLYSRPDYEAAVSPLLDLLMQREDIDLSRVALVGVSMGGYYAGRVACYEPRFRCIVLHGACHNIHDDLYENFPPIRPHLQWVTGTFNDGKARTLLQEFDLGPHLHRIKSPVFVCHGTEDFLVNPTAAEKTFNGLINVSDQNKKLRYFTAEENAGMHVQLNNPTEGYPVVFDWVIDQLTR